MRYKAPTTEDLGRLKARLGYTGSQMAELFGVSDDKQFRKYTGGSKPRTMNAQMLFFAMARLVLKKEDIEAVLDRMRQEGATIDLQASSDPIEDGEPPQ
jgi:catechol 2,3-dioxygenase-like lactoylglutathione lyase family enzyme